MQMRFWESSLNTQAQHSQSLWAFMRACGLRVCIRACVRVAPVHAYVHADAHVSVCACGARVACHSELACIQGPRQFFDASSHLYLVCPSVGRLVGQSVHPSVGHAFVKTRKIDAFQQMKPREGHKKARAYL